MKPLHAYIKQAQQFERILLKANKISNQLLHGSQKSLFKGQGTVFEETRKYQSGDDIRVINWSVTARLRETYVKTFSEEKGQTIWLALDASNSGIVGTKARTKRETLTELSAVLALTALKKNCRIGAIIFSDKVVSVHQPATTFAACASVLYSFLHTSDEHRHTDVRPALDYLVNVRQYGALIFILSDFIARDYQAGLKVLAQKHDLVGIQVYDQTEMDFPPGAYMHLLDAESQRKTFVNTSSSSFRGSHTDWSTEHNNYFRNTFYKLGQKSMSVATDEDYTEKLKFTLHPR